VLRAALAGVVHDSQNAANYEHSGGDDHQYRGFHCGLALRAPTEPIFRHSK
jgi:hypothetical protein